MTASTTRSGDRPSTTARNLSVRVSDLPARAGLILSAFGILALSCLPAAADDECGGIKVPGYTARRMIGPAIFRVAVKPGKERLEDVGGPGHVQIVDTATRNVTILDPKRKAVIALPPQPKPEPPPKKEGIEQFVDREPGQDGQVTISIGVKTPQGKDWVMQTVCRADGVWVQRKTKTPRGLVTASQTDIKVDTIPASQFEAPADYTAIKPK